MRINILRSARNDLEDGYLFYERGEDGVGEYFLRSLHADILSLKPIASGHQIINGYFRKHASRFPHSIFYKIEENEVRIYAVIDQCRDPEWISERLT